MKLNWIGSIARQADDGDSTLDYTADYYLVEAGLGVKNFGLKAGYEVLGGNTRANTTGFQTPLATLHAFQGWADKFTTTPQQGVEDFYVGGSANFGDLAMQLIYHDFQAEAVSQDFGTEWDASVGYKFGTRYEALLKYANYSAAATRPVRRHRTPPRPGCSSPRRSEASNREFSRRPRAGRDGRACGNQTRLRSDRRQHFRD